MTTALVYAVALAVLALVVRVRWQEARARQARKHDRLPMPEEAARSPEQPTRGRTTYPNPTRDGR